MSNEQNQTADGGPLQRMVRPSLHEYRVNATWTNYSEAEPPSDAYDEGTLRLFYDQAALDAAVAAERERCAAACAEVMNTYGGDPSGRLLSGDRVKMQHQLQASGAAQCIDRIKA